MNVLLKVVSVVLTVAAYTEAIVFSSVVLAYPLKWAWNCTIPYIFNLPRIDAIQAFCLYFVTNTLIKTTSK